MSLFRKRLVDGERLDIGGVCVRLRVNPRARRVSLRVDPVAGDVIATAPSLHRLDDAARFAKSRGAWIAQRLAERMAPPELLPGDIVTVFGAACAIETGGRRPRWIDASGYSQRRLVGCGEIAVDPQLVVRAIRREALSQFQRRAQEYCAALGVLTPSIAVMDARTRWGSCTPAKPEGPASIRLSWRLALAPVEVSNYVVAHECAHLLEANHGPRFWAHVRELVGDHRQRRAWLRSHGASLHAFGR
jgi:predicted metal-dependent hydrolase